MQKKVAIFGGSFDPPHNGHLAIMKNVLKTLKPDIFFIVPSFLNPFKDSFYFAPNTRLKWLEILKESLRNPKIIVVDFEVLQNAKTPTYKTLQFLQSHYGLKDSKIFLLLGADNVESLPKWENFALLQKSVEFVIIPRKGYQVPQTFKQLEFEEICVSSTHLRKKLEEKDFKSLEDKIPKEILESLIKETTCKKIERI